MLKYALSIVVCFFYLVSFSQGIQDSVFLIPEVKVSGNIHFEKDEAGMKATRIDSVVLLEKISADLSEVLSENTPVYIKNYGRGAMATASFRGTAPTHTQVSWNGININSPMLGMVDFSLIPVYIIDDMSLQHGAASISNQSGGLGGHISIQNEVDWQNHFSGRYYQCIGSFHTFDEFGQLNVGNEKIQSRTRAYHNYSKNNYPFLNKHLLPEPGMQRNENAAYSKYGIMQEIYYRPLPQYLISANFWYQNAGRSIPTVLTDESNDATKERINRQDDRTLKAVIKSDYYGEKFTIRAHSGFDLQQVDYINGYTLNNEENLNVNSGSDMLSWYNRMGTDYQINENITLKIKGHYNIYDISSLDSTTHLGYDITRQEASLFGGAYFALSPKLQLSLNLRQDWAEKMHTPLIYSAGLNYKPLKNENMVLKTSFARNFHNPTLNDMYWQPGGNPQLKPEKGYTAEAGVQWHKKSDKWSVETQATYYHSNITNWIIWLPARKGYWEPRNLKKVASDGLELMARIKARTGKIHYYLNGNYAITRTVNRGTSMVTGDESSGKQLPFIPLHSGNIFASASYRDYYINFQHNSYSKRYLLSSNNEENTLYPYHLNHAGIGKKWNWRQYRLNIELKVNNLFDEFYRSVLNRFMPGRHYMVMLKVDF